MMVASIDGDTRLIKRLDEAVRKMGNASVPLREIGDMLEDETSRQFDTQGRRLQSPWPALATSTIMQRIRSGYVDTGILERTGALRGSFSARLLGANVLHFGSSGVHYYRYHQLGEGRNPRRKMLGWTPRTRRQAFSIFRKFVVDALGVQR